MNKFNVVILKLPVLYEILMEIKSELNFNLFNFEENNEGFKNPYITTNPAFYSSGSATNGRTVGSYSGNEITITSAFTNSPFAPLFASFLIAGST